MIVRDLKARLTMLAVDEAGMSTVEYSKVSERYQFTLVDQMNLRTDVRTGELDGTVVHILNAPEVHLLNGARKGMTSQFGGLPIVPASPQLRSL